MDLKHLYILSEIISEKIDNGDLSNDVMDDMEVVINLSPTIYYGIDKEFYYMTHGNSYEGFVHSEDMVIATINGIKFKLLPKKNGE